MKFTSMELDLSNGYTCHIALPYDPTMFILLTLTILSPIPINYLLKMAHTSKIVTTESHCNVGHEKQWHNSKEEYEIALYRPYIIASR